MCSYALSAAVWMQHMSEYIPSEKILNRTANKVTVALLIWFHDMHVQRKTLGRNQYFSVGECKCINNNKIKCQNTIRYIFIYWCQRNSDHSFFTCTQPVTGMSTVREIHIPWSWPTALSLSLALSLVIVEFGEIMWI